MPTAVYERVSDTGQELAGQTAELRRWAEAQPASASWYRDKFTGKTMDRPGWERLWRDACAGKVDRIVVVRLDRLGRTPKGLVDLMTECQSRGINLVSLREGFDLSTPAGRMMFTVLAAVACYEIEVKQERQTAGIAEAKARGVYTGRAKGARGMRTAQQAKAVLTLHAAATPVSEIARATGLSRPTVYRILRQAPTADAL
jgi:DNA invertase Pin-like site-specific DNA recombinase